jgi:hypothetical protein
VPWIYRSTFLIPIQCRLVGDALCLACKFTAKAISGLVLFARPIFFVIWPSFRNIFMYGPLNDLISFFDPLFGATSHGAEDAEVTRLGNDVMTYDTEVPHMLDSSCCDDFYLA